LEDYFDIKLVIEYFPQILARIHITLLVVLVAALIGFILGILIAATRLYKIPVLEQLSIVYISFVRGTPIIVQLFIVYYGIPLIVQKIFHINLNRIDAIYFVILTYGLNSGAFLSEVIRSAISSVNAGQTEAAYSVGLTKIQTFLRIIAPQALVTAIPNFGTSMAGLLQDSSLAFSLGIIDVMGKVQAIGSVSYHVLEGYVVAAIIFLVLGILLERAFKNLEKRASFKKGAL